MASETGSSDQFQSNRGIPILFPFIFGFSSPDPPQESQDQSTSGEPRGPLIIINPLTQSMIVMESSGVSLGLDSLFGDLASRKSGPRSASKAAIDAMPTVEIAKGENDDDEHCVVCLEEWVTCESAKEMPCKHRFHGNCIEKWLKINGSCPVCRFEMPANEDEDASRKIREENDGDRRRGIWLTFNFGRNNQNSSSDHQETLL
ncbi:hypothetical protein ACS0TY_008939 [Phlomoides rotata]